MTEAPTRHRPGSPCWVSLMAHSLATTQDFYGALFGWTFRPGPRTLGPYVRAVLDGHVVAGLGELPPDRRLPVAWTPYVASDDADVTAERIRCYGGTIGVGPLDAGDAGRMVIASDPTGAVFGVWQGGEHVGAEDRAKPGTPVWNELLTRDAPSAAKFYAAVFGHETEAGIGTMTGTGAEAGAGAGPGVATRTGTGAEAGPEAGAEVGPGAGAVLAHSAGPESGGPAKYDVVTLHADGRPVAAVYGVGRALPRDRGPHWMTYFEVADADAAVRRVADLGGHVVRPARDTPLGRLATVEDPEGARFAVVTSPR